MKKILLFAALAIAATLNAQQADTLVSLQQIAATNLHVQKFEKAVGTSVTMAGIGIAVSTLGIYTLVGNGQEAVSSSRAKFAKMAVIGGAVLAVASIVPVSVNGIKLDHRGLVIDLPDGSKKKKR